MHPAEHPAGQPSAAHVSPGWRHLATDCLSSLPGTAGFDSRETFAGCSRIRGDCAADSGGGSRLDEGAQPHPHSKELLSVSYPAALLFMFGLAVPMTAAIHFADCVREGSAGRDPYDVYARPVAAQRPVRIEKPEQPRKVEARIAVADATQP